MVGFIRDMGGGASQTSHSDATATPADVAEGVTFYAGQVQTKQTGTMQTLEGGTVTPGAADIIFGAGKKLLNQLTVKGDANLLAKNIRAGKSIFGVNGVYPYIKMREYVRHATGGITITISEGKPVFMYYKLDLSSISLDPGTYYYLNGASVLNSDGNCDTYGQYLYYSFGTTVNLFDFVNLGTVFTDNSVYIPISCLSSGCRYKVYLGILKENA